MSSTSRITKALEADLKKREKNILSEFEAELGLARSCPGRHEGANRLRE